MRRISAYLQREVWLVDLEQKSGLAWLGLAALRVLLHALGNFNSHLLGIRAAGLTMVTLLALVPMLAFAFGIADFFGYGEQLQDWLDTQAVELPAELQDLMMRLRDLVARTSFRTLGWLSSLILMYSGYALFGKVEQALNHAWQTHKRRRWLRRISDFVALAVFVPLLVLFAILLQSLLQSAQWIQGMKEGLPWLAPLYDAGLGLVPYALIWIAFTGLYKFMPNARVKWSAAMIAGIFAGTLYLLVHGFYIYFQVGVARFNAIYATIAALPLLLIYLQLAWTIALLGAELSYGLANLDQLGRRSRMRAISSSLRERIGIWLVAKACRDFATGSGPQRIAELSAELDVPGEVLENIAQDLVAARLLLEIEGDDPGFVPARLPTQIFVIEVRRALRGELPADLAERCALSPSLSERLALVEKGEHEILAGADFGPDD